MRLLFSTIPLEGHVRPTLPLARALLARGTCSTRVSGKLAARTLAAEIAPLPDADEVAPVVDARISGR